ncbi:MAG: NADH-quinone oxidoreductase subunit N [Candidatus Ancaeobacter aquaticus]|nr:NADH-quinone oxidoreductase subunit N [Candidatus Ancaeobacter aquaticus]
MTLQELYVHAKYISPELFLIFSGFCVVLCGKSFRNQQKILGIATVMSFVVAMIILGFCAFTYPDKELFYGMVRIDPFSLTLRFLIFITMILVGLLSMGDEFNDKKEFPEYFALLLFNGVGLSFLVMANNLLLIYLSLELVSLTTYILVSVSKRTFLAGEASLKYFLFGALSTAIFLFGISMVYGLTGTLDLGVMSVNVARGGIDAGVMYVALVFLLVGFGFKIAMVPFHMWAPDAYQGASTPITAFMSVAPKIAAFGVFLRIFYSGIGDFGVNWHDLIGVLAVITMTVGNILAISQNNIKRMLAYSSIAQAGYILIGFAVPTLLGKEAVLMYLLVYIFMNIGAFTIAIMLIRSLKSEQISDFRGLAKIVPGTAFAFAVFLLSLAGIPPLAGFLGKFYVFSAAIESHMIYLALAGIINSVIGLYYYVRVIKYMYVDTARRDVTIVTHPALTTAVIISLVGTLIIGIYPTPFIKIITFAVSIF